VARILRSCCAAATSETLSSVEDRTDVRDDEDDAWCVNACIGAQVIIRSNVESNASRS
jgi:hypothetical protein